MTRRPRWMESVLRTAQSPLPALPFSKASKALAA